MNETEIEEGDNVLTVFYRKDSITPNDVPLVDLAFHHFSQQRKWPDLEKDAQSQMRGVSPISLIQTAKNIGGAHNQFLFYTKGSDPNGAATTKTLRREDGDWASVISETKNYLNKFIPPHNLISVSFYEDEHENTGKGINACITHTAGDSPAEITQNDKIDVTELYSFDVIVYMDDLENLFL